MKPCERLRYQTDNCRSRSLVIKMDNLNEDKAKDPASTDGEWLTVYNDRNDSKTKKCEIHAKQRKLRINGEDEVSFKHYDKPLSMLRVLAKNANNEVKHSDLWKAYREGSYSYASDYGTLRKDKERLCKLLNTKAPISVEGGWGELIDGSERRYGLRLNASGGSDNNHSRGLSESLTCSEKGVSDEAIKQTEMEEIRNYFLLDLTPFSYGIEASDAYVNRNWLCGKVSEWLDSPEQQMLIIQGGPGTGKSSFAKHELMHDKRVSAFVSFRWKDPIANSARYASEAIAHQLAEHNSAYRQALLKIIRQEKAALSDSAKGSNSWRSSSSPFSVYVTNIVRGLDIEHDSFVIVLDGLDEFVREARGSRSVNSFVDMIAEENLPSSMRLLVLARNDSPTIKPLRRSASLLVLEDYSNEVSGDINAYVKAMLKGMPDDVIVSVVESSKSSFLYASLVCRGILAGDIDGASELPTSLAAVYRSYFDRVTGTETFGDDMRAALCVLCSSPELVPEKTLRNAVGWTRGKVHRYSSFMRLFGMYLESDGSDCLAFFHKSLSDFLVSEEADDYMVDKAWGCELLAKACYIAYQENMEDMIFFELSNIIPFLQADEKGNSSEIANVLSDTDFADFVTSKANSRSSQENRVRLLSASHMIYRSNMHRLGAENLEKLARVSMLLAEALHVAGADSVRIEELYVDAYEATNLLPKENLRGKARVLHLKSLLHIFDIALTLSAPALSKNRLRFERDWLCSACVDEEFDAQLKSQLSCWDLEVFCRLSEELGIGNREVFHGNESFFGGCGNFLSNRFLRAIAERLDEQRKYTYDYAACVVAKAKWLNDPEIGLQEKAGELLAVEAGMALAQKQLSSAEEIFSAARIVAEYAYYSRECVVMVSRYKKSNWYAAAARNILSKLKSQWPLDFIKLYHSLGCLIARNIYSIRGIVPDGKISAFLISDFDMLSLKCSEHQNGWMYINDVSVESSCLLDEIGCPDSVDMLLEKCIGQRAGCRSGFRNSRYRIEYILAYAGIAEGGGYQDALGAIAENKSISHADRNILLKLAKVFHDLFPAIGLDGIVARLNEARICVGPFSDHYVYDAEENVLLLSERANDLSSRSKEERTVVLAHFLVDLIASHGSSCGFDNDTHDFIRLSEAFAEKLGRYVAKKADGCHIGVTSELYGDELSLLEIVCEVRGICKKGESDSSFSLSFGEFFSGGGFSFDMNAADKALFSFDIDSLLTIVDQQIDQRISVLR